MNQGMSVFMKSSTGDPVKDKHYTALAAKLGVDMTPAQMLREDRKMSSQTANSSYSGVPAIRAEVERPVPAPQQSAPVAKGFAVFAREAIQ